MKKILVWFIGLIFISLILAPLAQAEKVPFLGENIEIMRLKDVKPGMNCWGLSDFGQGKEKFTVKIVTITYEALISGYVIWIKYPKGFNETIDKTGTSAGMSGSPIYITENGQDKLIGALAYGYGFQPPIPPIEAEAGIQPIEPILSELQTLFAAYYGNPNIQPVNSANILEPGDPIAFVLSSGDMPVAAVGTVTLSTSKIFIALGHSLLKTGYSNIPAFGSEIGTVSCTVFSSFKKATGITGSQLGTAVVDSTIGVLGVWHTKSTMFPLKINFRKYHLNNFQIDKQWNVRMAPRNPLSSKVLTYCILKAIELGSPDIGNLFFNIKTNFTYEESGNKKTLSVYTGFFSKTGQEISPSITILENIYTSLERAKKKLTKIDIDFVITQEEKDITVMELKKIEAEDEVEPNAKISLGLVLDEKRLKYSMVIEFNAPGFPGELKIKIQDREHRLQELIDKALKDPQNIEDALKFIENSAKKDNVFYVEITFVQSITEQKIKSNTWKTSVKRAEEAINRTILEIELPKIKEKFTTNISKERTIKVKYKPKEEKPKEEK